MTTFTTVGIGDVIPQEFMAQTGVIEHALPLLIGIAFLPVWMWALFNWIHILFVKYTFRGKASYFILKKILNLSEAREILLLQTFLGIDILPFR